MNNKKSQIAANPGISTIFWWALILGIGIVLLVILGTTTDAGRTALGNLRKIFPYV